MKNKKGFTLVELLAVIVVLAIIMIIAVPSVLNSMTDARRNSFVVYAEKLINSAQAQAQATQMVNGIPSKCYDIDELIDGATGAYKGFVSFEKTGETETYKVYLHDNNYVVAGITAMDLEKQKANKDLDSEFKEGKILIYDTEAEAATDVTMDQAYSSWSCKTDANGKKAVPVVGDKKASS